MTMIAGCPAPDDTEQLVASGTDTDVGPQTDGSEDGSSTSVDPTGAPTTGEDPTQGSAETGGGSETGEDPTNEIPEFSPGCGLPLSTDWLEPYTVFWGEETVMGTVEAVGLQREFLVELPEPYDPDQPYPIVFTFHGYGAEMDNAFGQNVADLWDAQVIAVYPQGLGDPSSWRTSPNAEDVAFFIAMMNAIGSQMCVDMNRVFVQGTSMGGIMANALGCARADLVDGVGAIASSFPLSSDQCTGPTPAWVMHGRNDGTVGFGSGEQVRDIWLSINGCGAASTPISGTPCVTYDECDGNAPVVWCPHDGGHDLPSVQGLDDDLMGFFKSL